MRRLRLLNHSSLAQFHQHEPSPVQQATARPWPWGVGSWALWPTGRRLARGVAWLHATFTMVFWWEAPGQTDQTESWLSSLVTDCHQQWWSRMCSTHCWSCHQSILAIHQPLFSPCVESLWTNTNLIVIKHSHSNMYWPWLFTITIHIYPSIAYQTPRLTIIKPWITHCQNILQTSLNNHWTQ